MDKLVVIGSLPDWFGERYLPGLEVETLEEPGREGLLESLDGTVAGIVARGSTRVDGEIMDAAPGLRVIGRTGVGFNTIDVAAATRRGVPVLFTPAALSRAVAEHAMALILAAAKDLTGWHRRVLEGRWEQRYHLVNLDLEEATVGMVGFGSIGRELWKLLAPFRVRGLANDPCPGAFPPPDPPVTMVGLERLLAESDIVTLHLPLDETTRGLINSGNIGLFREGAILVNTARGALIESDDLLLEALEQGRLGYVALDTLIREPPDPGHPLFRHPRALFSAHVASRTARAQQRMLETLGEDLRSVLRGARPLEGNVLNPEVFEG